MDCRIFFLLLLFNHFIDFSSGRGNGFCRPQGGRFPPFASEGKPPGRVQKGSKDLTLCRLFRKNTCCDVAQTHPALVAIRKLALTGEGSQECLQLWELLECSICDPKVGVQPGPPLICSSLCDRVFDACSDAYLSMDTMTQTLGPCGASDLVCGRASEWVSNGTDLCQAAGFAVKPSETEYAGLQEKSCYGGKASLDSISDSWRNPRSEVTKKTEKPWVLEDILQWKKYMPFNERVSWAVGGMVLTAGLLFISKRRSHNQRQNLVAIQRTARRMRFDSKTSSPRSPVSQGYKKGSGR